MRWHLAINSGIFTGCNQLRLLPGRPEVRGIFGLQFSKVYMWKIFFQKTRCLNNELFQNALSSTYSGYIVDTILENFCHFPHCLYIIAFINCEIEI
jgi:hypothetical protein